jgi:NitT/TauT family transport system permease protein
MTTEVVGAIPSPPAPPPGGGRGAVRDHRLPPHPGGRVGERGLARKLWDGNALPVALVVLAILVLWHVGTVALNWQVVHDTRVRMDQPAGWAEVLPATFAMERPILPAPHQIVSELWRTTVEVPPTSRRSLVFHAQVTLTSAMLGFVIGTVFGIVLAIGIVHVRVLEASLMPWIVASQTVPILAVAPIVIVALGSIGLTGVLPKAIIAAYLCFFPVAIGMVKGLTSPDVLQRELMRTWSASPMQTFWKLRLPASVPFLFASLKVAVSISLVGAIVGELPTGAQAGLGARLLAGSYFGQTVQMWAALFAAAILAAVLVFATGAIERGVRTVMGARPEGARR